MIHKLWIITFEIVSNHVDREHKLKMKKMEKEMESVFETKVNEKKTKLNHSEKELIKKHDQVLETISRTWPWSYLVQQKKKYEQDQADLEQRRRDFEKERAEWEEKIKAEQAQGKSKVFRKKLF